MLTEVAGTQGTAYDSSERGLLAKISLKSVLTSFPCSPRSGDKAIPCCPAPPHILCLIPWWHQAGQTLCKRKGDYLRFAGLADDEWEYHRIPRAASQERGRRRRRQAPSAPRAAAGLTERRPLARAHARTRKAAVSLVAFPATGWCAPSLTTSWPSSLGLGFTDCPS